MRLRSSGGSGSTPTRDPPPDAPETSARSWLVRALLVVALASAVAYALSRYARGLDVDEPLEAIRDRTTSILPSAVEEHVSTAAPTEPETIPIGGDESDDDGLSVGAQDGGDGVGTDGTRTRDEETNVDLANDRSAAEIGERTTDDIQEEPAEPGELTVDEDVEDLLDEASDESDDEDED
ncbi:hypothetical protein [Natrarchaeobius oligotrophus]|uniref:Uncharacterized protein n=1 Tax=Natrarchaeobius chitinivorans TaxID=1679083 RepID=A0A3N6MRW4_NATCH|nr:hypothetical protein [Natrarchaeobius chitinivorans]RQG99021.1 hypothetical protein EA472_15905 [Natrarchaeobius chitinivorans]